jgi:hypothetical protein
MNRQYKGWEIAKMVSEETIKDDTELKCISIPTNTVFECYIKHKDIFYKSNKTELNLYLLLSDFCVFEINEDYLLDKKLLSMSETI